MSWIRAGAIFAAFSVHAALAASFVSLEGNQDPSALQSGQGKDDLSIVARVTVQNEESIGLDAVSAQHQDASTAAMQASPSDPKPGRENTKKEETVQMEAPVPPQNGPDLLAAQKKPSEKQFEAEKPAAEASQPAVAAAAEEEQRAMSRDLDARRSHVLSLYNAKIYRAVMQHALRPKKVQTGRVIVELTLAPSGVLLAHRVVASSGSGMLDRTAMASLERAAPFPPAPKELRAEPYTLSIPFEYEIK